MAGRTVRLATGIVAPSGVGDQIVTEADDNLALQSGDLLITQSSDGLVSVHAMTVGLAEYTRTVALLAGLAATSDTAQRLLTQAGGSIVTQAGGFIITQTGVAADSISVLEPSVTVTGS